MDAKETYEDVLERYFGKGFIPKDYHECTMNPSCTVYREVLEFTLSKLAQNGQAGKKKKKVRSTGRHKQVECKVCLRKMRSDNLKRHMKRKGHMITLNEAETVISHDEFQFESFITGYYYYRHIWTPQIDEELTTAHEHNNIYDEFAVSILKNNDTIVGHIPRQISKQCTALMKSGGTVNVKVNANPVNTRTQGIRVPCTYIISGNGSLVQDIKDNVCGQ